VNEGNWRWANKDRRTGPSWGGRTSPGTRRGCVWAASNEVEGVGFDDRVTVMLPVCSAIELALSMTARCVFLQPV